jgi:hypothetical protein
MDSPFPDLHKRPSAVGCSYPHVILLSFPDQQQPNNCGVEPRIERTCSLSILPSSDNRLF